jgi:hypothetical protein
MTRPFPDPAALQTATRFSPSLRSRRPPLLACAIGKDPPLARPRPRELAVRLEEDRAHACLGQATPDDLCNTRHDARTHPSSDPSSSVNFERPRPLVRPCFRRSAEPTFSPSYLLSQWYRGEDEPREPLSQPARAEGSRAKDLPFDRRAPLLAPFPRAPGSPHPCFGGAGDSPSRRWTRPRSPSAAAPRRATVSERPRCFAPLRNPNRSLALAILAGARREIAPACDAPDRPSVTPPLTFP